MVAKPTHNLFLQIKYDFFFPSAPTAALKWIRWYFKQTCQEWPRYEVNPTRKSPGTFSRIDSTFRRLISLGFLVFVQQQIPKISQLLISAILKYANLGTNTSKFAALPHMFAVKVSNVKLLCIAKRSKINELSWTCIRAKCRVTQNRNAPKNLYKICFDSPLDLVLTCLARHDIFLSLFHAKLCFLLFTSDLWWVSRPHVGGVSYQNW